MKLLVILSVAALVSAAPQAPPMPSIPGGVDIPGAILGSFNEVTRQVNNIQSVLGELNGQFARLVQSGTRLVSGLQAESGSGPALPDIGAAGGIVGAAIGSVQQVTGQLTNIQRTIMDMTNQLQRMIQTGTRIVTGPLYADNGMGLPQLPNPNIADAALKTFNDWSQQLQSISGVLREMNQQWSRVIETGSKIMTGKLMAEETTTHSSSPLPNLPGMEAVQSAMTILQQQFTSIQRALTDFSSQLSRMVESGIRTVAGLEGESTPSLPQITSPGESVLNVVNTMTQQFTQVQRVLQDLNAQLNRMIETGSRMVG